jgi:hypothetical protein
MLQIYQNVWHPDGMPIFLSIRCKIKRLHYIEIIAKNVEFYNFVDYDNIKLKVPATVKKILHNYYKSIKCKAGNFFVDFAF